MTDLDIVITTGITIMTVLVSGMQVSLQTVKIKITNLPGCIVHTHMYSL